MSAIEVDRLTVRYGDVVAVHELSFTAEAGQVTCILGRNGAGKTSTIEALEGLRPDAGGRLSVLGHDPRRRSRDLARRIGVMLQDVGIQPAARAAELLRHAAAMYPSSLDARALLDRVGLIGRERRAFRQLSGGEQRRLALALALVGRPEVAFLDEPTTGVDPAGRQVVRQIVSELRDQGVAVLLSTHDLDEAERLADRVVIVHEGRLLADGTVADLHDRDPDVREMRFRGPTGLDTVALSEHLGGPHHDVPVREDSPGDYRIAAEPTPWLVATVTVWLAERDVTLTDLRTGGQSLEETFLRLTGGAGETSADDDTGASSETDDADGTGKANETGGAGGGKATTTGATETSGATEVAGPTDGADAAVDAGRGGRAAGSGS